MKHLKIVNIPDASNTLGFLTYHKNIYINVQEIWNRTWDEDEFIKLFSKALLHEKIHYILRCNDVSLKYRISEEPIVIMMCGEKITKWQKKRYKELYNESKI